MLIPTVDKADGRFVDQSRIKRILSQVLRVKECTLRELLTDWLRAIALSQYWRLLIQRVAHSLALSQQSALCVWQINDIIVPSSPLATREKITKLQQNTRSEAIIIKLAAAIAAEREWVSASRRMRRRLDCETKAPHRRQGWRRGAANNR